MNFHTFILLLTYVCIASQTNAQKSILRNGGFEEHAEIRCLNCLSRGEYGSHVYNWHNDNWGCQLCDKQYKQNSVDKKWGICPMDRISPQSGDAMIEMLYLPDVNGIFGGVEGASHLSAKTTEPMQVGQLYEVSLWLYVESGKRHDPDWGKHLGIALLPQNLTFFNGRNSLIIPFIGVDTLIYDQWYQAKWRVRPLCTSNYLMIGVFADPQWPRSHSYTFVKYYLDNVSVVEKPELSAVSDSSIYYCSRYDPVALGATPVMDNQILLYENDAFALTSDHQAVLDTFATYVKKYPDLIFELSGHTDSIGNDNIALSQKRVQAVHTYLTEVLKIPTYRFYTRAMGGDAPYRPNTTEAGRILNRRTEIRQSTLTLEAMFYRAALKAMKENNVAAAFSYLDRWTAKVDKGSSILLLFDPRFERLRSDKRWPLLEKKVRASYKNLKYARESFLIDSLRFETCRYEGEPLAVILNRLPGNVPGEDRYEVEIPGKTEAAVRKQSEMSYKTIYPILQKTGWPKKGNYSESAVNNAFHLLMNSGDIAAHLTWLPALEQACLAGELPWKMYAFCYDHIRVLLGKPQRYLLYYQNMEDGSVELSPWEGDENTVNDWRAKIGLPLLPQAVVEAMREKK